MKGCGKFLAVVLLALGLMSFATKVQGQALTLIATSSPTSVQISNFVTFTISVSNSSAAPVPNLFITNTFNVSIGTQLTVVNITGDSYTPAFAVETNANNLLF